MPMAGCRSPPSAPAIIPASLRRCDQDLTIVIARARRQRNPVSCKISGLLRGACHRARIRATRWLAMTFEFVGALGIIRGVRFAKNMDRIARLQVAPLKCRIGIEHEICDRERADPVKCPYRETFHQLSALSVGTKTI